MRPIITITAVVLLHLCVIAVLVGVNGCRSTTGLETDGDPVAYAAGGRAASAAAPAPVAGLPVATAATAAPVPVLTTGRLATPPPTKVAPITPAGAGGIHVVVKGEVLSIIAMREKVSPKALADANGISLNAVLQPGQKLKIPAPGAPATKPAATTTKPAAATNYRAPSAPTIEFTPLRLSTTPAPAAETAPAAPATK